MGGSRFSLKSGWSSEIGFLGKVASGAENWSDLGQIWGSQNRSFLGSRNVKIGFRPRKSATDIGMGTNSIKNLPQVSEGIKGPARGPPPDFHRFGPVFSHPASRPTISRVFQFPTVFPVFVKVGGFYDFGRSHHDSKVGGRKVKGWRLDHNLSGSFGLVIIRLGSWHRASSNLRRSWVG